MRWCGTSTTGKHRRNSRGGTGRYTRRSMAKKAGTRKHGSVDDLERRLDSFDAAERKGALAALIGLAETGEIKLGEAFVIESLLGTTFSGRALRETACGPYPAVVPMVTGSAFITGRSEFQLDVDDPLKYGFILR